MKRLEVHGKGHCEIFHAIAIIYKNSMIFFGLSPIPVILVEVQMKVKSTVAWEVAFDMFFEFCGAKDDHVCNTNFTVMVGSWLQHHFCLISFQQGGWLCKVGGFARVVVVIPLHEKLP
jgi:hypothetical protein